MSLSSSGLAVFLDPTSRLLQKVHHLAPRGSGGRLAFFRSVCVVAGGGDFLAIGLGNPDVYSKARHSVSVYHLHDHSFSSCDLHFCV